MTNPPDVVFAATSKLKKQLESIAWGDISVGPLDAAQPETDQRRAQVLVLDSDEAAAVWSTVEEYALDSPLYPLIIGHTPEHASAPLRLASVLTQPIDGIIQGVVRRLLEKSAWLHRELSSVDPATELLTQNSLCEWNRCSVGIVGIIRVCEQEPFLELPEQLEVLRQNAYAAIDRIPTARLSTDDLWTLLLIVSVPWTRSELDARDAETTILRTFVADTIGSRKVTMCSDESVKALVGPVGGTGSFWYPTSDDPLHDQVRLVTKSHEELQALEILFKRRFSPDDIDRLIGVLGKRL